MASGPQPPGEAGADAHSLIKLRERTDYPQLRDIPPDLRVSGARHASRESLPPSKPNRPHAMSGPRRTSATHSLIPTIVRREKHRRRSSSNLDELRRLRAVLRTSTSTKRGCSFF